jgi:hypothetical protein
MIATSFHRPEDRQRSGRDGTAWDDTLPACFRSEAFAEDLDGPTEPAPRAAAATRQPLTPAWRLWYGLAPR